jgi:putative ABC transport system substrate-binding protein
MVMVKVGRKVLACVSAFLTVGSAIDVSAQSAKLFRLGYFEGGNYPFHHELREEFIQQLQLILPEGYSFVFAPEGYRSAEWKRDTCRVMARQLAQLESIDMVLAVGPWVVEDLLEAGFTKPILAMHQFDPIAQGLVGHDGRPVASNLTVHVRPGKVEDDLKALTSLIKVKRLGVLYFPSGSEGAEVIATIDSLGKKMGFEVVTAEGFDNYGTYAFFKAYHQLDKKIDALYLPPLWGMDANKVEAFLRETAGNRIPTFTFEAKELVETGAMGSNSAFAVVAEARYNAFKALRIMQGELPANLPIEFRAEGALALNEQTARQCQVALPNEALAEAYVVPAPVPEGTPQYNLSQAVERALSYNPGYLAQYDALEAAVQAAGQAYSAYLPHVVARSSVLHVDDNTVANLRGRLQDDQYRASLTLQQRIFSAEAIKSIQMAAKRKERERINVRQAKLDLSLAVAVAYLNYLRAQELLKAHLEYRSLIDRFLEIAHARLLLEQGSQIDQLRFRQERYQATSQVIYAESEVKVARVLLNVLFNLPGNSFFVLDSLSFSESQSWHDYNRLRSLAPTEETHTRLQDFLVNKALAANPLLQTFDLDITLQKDMISQNTARYYPTLDFRAQVSYSDMLADEPPLFSEQNTTWWLWGGLTIPIFLGTDRIKERAKLKAQMSQIEFEKDSTSLEIMGKIHSGMYDLMAQGGIVPRDIRSRELARENLGLVSETYESGKGGLLELLDALENLLDNEEAAIAARYDFYLTMAYVVHDIGWSPERGNTYPEEFFIRLTEHFQN